jgi:hypothetical protein
VSTLPRFAPVLAAVCLLPAAGCTTLRPDAAANTPPASPQEQLAELAGDAPAEPLQTAEARVQYHVMAGEMAAARQHPAQAAREFLAALEYIADAELARRTAMMAVAARDEDLSLAAARRWLQIEPDSADPRELVTTLSLQQGDLVAAMEQAAELIRRHPAGPADGFMHVAQIMAQLGEERADGARSWPARIMRSALPPSISSASIWPKSQPGGRASLLRASATTSCCRSASGSNRDGSRKPMRAWPSSSPPSPDPPSCG